MKDCNEIADCSSRREFLVKAAFMAGGLALTLSGSAFGTAFEDVVIPIDDQSPLNKIGGSAVVDSAAGKIIILRTGDAAFVAFSAKCTHKGGIVSYDAAKKQFLCPKHSSSFDPTNGNPTGGPAEDPLKSFKTNGTKTSVTVVVA